MSQKKSRMMKNIRRFRNADAALSTCIIQISRCYANALFITSGGEMK